MSKFRHLCLLILFALASCNSIMVPQPTELESALLGYVTQCRSSVLIDSGSNAFTSSIIVNAGEQELIIKAISEPEVPDDYSSTDSYFCRDITIHHVNFISKGGKRYRLHLDEKGNEKYSISVWEGLDSRAIETRPTEYTSNQVSIRRECRFLFECLSDIRFH